VGGWGRNLAPHTPHTFFRSPQPNMNLENLIYISVLGFLTSTQPTSKLVLADKFQAFSGFIEEISKDAHNCAFSNFDVGV
jgi:hypothetical protein